MRVFEKKSGVAIDLHPRNLLGSGSEGAVYRDGDRCVKVLNDPPSERGAEALEVLARLGRTVPGFAWPLDLVTHATTNTVVGFTLPFVPGQTLEAALDARETANWPAATKAKLALDIASAVMNAHALTGPTVALGDTIKPANIQVDDKRATFIDTGSVSVFQYRSADGSLTDWVNELSTPGYVPTEVLDNPSAIPNHATDLFALAVTLFEVIYGRHPVEPKPAPGAVGLDPDEAVREGLFLRWVRHPEFEPPSYDPVNVPNEIEALFRSAFLGRPDQRPPAEVWVKAIKRWRRSLRPKPTPPPPPAPKPRRRWPSVFLFVDAAITAFVMLAATAVLGHWYVRNHERIDGWIERKKHDPLPTKPVGPDAFREVYR